MVIVEFGNIELDTCVDCRGLWFDAQELGQLFELAGCPNDTANWSCRWIDCRMSVRVANVPAVAAGWSRCGHRPLATT